MILYAPSVTKILHSVHLILGSAQNFTFMASSLLDIVLFINSIKFSGFLAKREFLWLIRTCISVWDWRFDPQFSQSMQAIPTPSYIDLIMFSPTLPPPTGAEQLARSSAEVNRHSSWTTLGTHEYQVSAFWYILATFKDLNMKEYKHGLTGGVSLKVKSAT